MLFQYNIIFIFKVLHVSSSLNSSSGTVYEQSLHIASQYTLKDKLAICSFSDCSYAVPDDDFNELETCRTLNINIMVY
jgi:hypothetical protein